MYTKVFIPYGGYYSTPFVRWQGSLQNEHAVELAAATTKKWLASREIDPKIFEYLVFGKTIGQLYTFYDAPWAAYLMGNPDISGMHITQACSTSTTVLNQASAAIETGLYETSFCMLTDRCSNGPFTVWPNPKGPGGEMIAESWMMDNFDGGPWRGVPMLQTAENVVNKAGGITKEDVDKVTARRYEQYQDALVNDRAFQKRYMIPVDFKISKKKIGIVEADEGVTPTTLEGLTALKSVIPGGVHSFGAQTHPADGNCGLIVTTREKARALSTDKNIEVQILAYGFARAEKAHMAMAVVPAARMALEKAGVSITDVKAIKTHNPFTANDLYMANEMGIDVMTMNNYGCSLIYGHPQGPTAGRAIIEMIEELAILGGGFGLFTGCAAGDTGAALVIKVS
ncbi:thiolase family protein [Desulfosporosinus meridiei]|uniref:Acetoacetyl-CoA thiolase n=1 Tax=Desulfosporosinus meridiei (strain ATCC BAA-275 / DSM 13257 / KCTC 12902 / NCIMB 13706 / S10) TaxID=768704 RepID=J7IPX3_DESMD|nr:thiolase family protein [Desulfosporosinus meridiei]AFQ43690.1 acetyl-CoA acetyltransferase [Desulfosporosinus meridiei DSM 13257]